MNTLTQVIIKEAVRTLTSMEGKNRSQVGAEFYDAHFAKVIDIVRNNLSKGRVSDEDINMYEAVVDLVNDMVDYVANSGCKCCKEKAEEKVEANVEDIKASPVPMYDADREWQVIIGINKKNHKLEKAICGDDSQIHVLMVHDKAFGYMASVMHKPQHIDEDYLDRLAEFIKSGSSGSGVAFNAETGSYSIVLRYKTPLHIKNDMDNIGMTNSKTISHADSVAIRNALNLGFRMFKQDKPVAEEQPKVEVKAKSKTKKTKPKAKK